MAVTRRMVLVALYGFLAPIGGSPLRRPDLDVSDWTPPDGTTLCPSLPVVETFPRISSNVPVKSLACDWDKILRDKSYSRICSQAFVKIGVDEVKVACLPQKRLPRKAERFNFGEGAVFEERRRVRRKVGRCLNCRRIRLSEPECQFYKKFCRHYLKPPI